MTGLIRSPYPRQRGTARTILLVAGWITIGPDTAKALQRKLNEHKVGYAG